MNKATRINQNGKRGDDLGVVQAAVHYLMTKYAMQPDASIAAAIAHHFKLLNDRHIENGDRNAGLYRHLSTKWGKIAEERMLEKESI
ncbi:MAG TPA: hypothetical protein EYP34_07770 [Chromatiaceae bacterium]|nr:hypothetical protein [Chromatiaceae bacterium]